ncbi:hypothetical protein [Cohnella panacarvi]|uniref:hypothetical protein n=1 Tax=Cohnella panacarvi TaxID=400776 RepID=UPI000479DDDD|nr:hypothetical protein [Cohnella panacarvi]
MDLYHSWVYERLLNTEWFMWTLVFSVLGINILSPLIVWYVVGGRRAISKVIRMSKRQRSDE